MAKLNRHLFVVNIDLSTLCEAKKKSIGQDMTMNSSKSRIGIIM